MHLRGDLQPAGKGVHAADVGVDQVDRVGALAAHLGVEVEPPALGEPAVAQHLVHHQRGVVEVHGELIGVPAQQQVAGVGVDAAQQAVVHAVLDLVVEGVAGQGGVVGLDVQAKVLHQAVLLQERVAAARVKVVLVLGGLFGLGLDPERAVEADLLFVVHREIQKQPEVIHLALQVGVQQCLVAFAAAPEHVAAAAKLLRALYGLLDLRRGVGEDVGVGAGGRAAHKSRVAEGVGGAPQQFDARLVLLLLGERDDLVQVFVGFRKCFGLRGDVAVVEAPVRQRELAEKLEHGVHGVLGGFHAPAVFPRHDPGARAKRVGPGPAHAVPVAAGEAQVLFHGLAHDHRVGVVVLERQRVLAVGALVGDRAWNVGEVGSGHKSSSSVDEKNAALGPKRPNLRAIYR